LVLKEWGFATIIADDVGLSQRPRTMLVKLPINDFPLKAASKALTPTLSQRERECAEITS
jgi:hypothetical protein